MTLATAPEVRPRSGSARRRRAGWPGTLRSEVTKIISVRSTYWTLALLVLASVVWSVVYCAGTAAHWPHMSAQSRAGFDPTQSGGGVPPDQNVSAHAAYNRAMGACLKGRGYSVK